MAAVMIARQRECVWARVAWGSRSTALGNSMRLIWRAGIGFEHRSVEEGDVILDPR